MKFNELDTKMRLFETRHDQTILPEIYMVARLDGRSFTRLTKEIHQFEAPYDTRFRDAMIVTAKHVMDCGFKVIYGYTQSDEISLLFHPDEQAFARKVRKYNSILAGEASAKISLLWGDVTCFDCRLSQLPMAEDVIDYFRWRFEDAQRNTLNAHCYWLLRQDNQDNNAAQAATAKLKGLSVAQKGELLRQHGRDFDDVPAWQKGGVGLYWALFKKEGWNPKTQEAVVTTRRKLSVNFDLPVRDHYAEFIAKFLEEPER